MITLSDQTSSVVATAKQYYVYIKGIKRTDCKLLSVDLAAGGNADICSLQFPRNYFMNNSGLAAGNSVKVTINGISKPIFCGELREPSSTINPPDGTWIATNGITNLNNTAITRKFNKGNSKTYSFANKTGYYAADIIEEIIIASGVNIQYSKSSFPTDWIGPCEFIGERPVPAILQILSECLGKYTLKMEYNSDGTQTLKVWKFGATNNNSKTLIVGTLDRDIDDAEGGVANINEGTYTEDRSAIVNHFYGFGHNKHIETSVYLVPAWDVALEAAVLADPSIVEQFPEIYGDVFVKWALPPWTTYDTSTGNKASEWAIVSTWPKVLHKNYSDSLVAGKINYPFLWVNNPRIPGGYITYAGTDYSPVNNLFSIKQDANGNDRYVIISKDVVFRVGPLGAIAACDTVGNIIFTATFEIPEALWVNTGQQGSESEDRINVIQDNRYIYAWRGTGSLANSPGSNILATSIMPIFTASVLTGADVGANYALVNDSDDFYNRLSQKVEFTMNKIKRLSGVNLPRTDFSLTVGDYILDYEQNIIHVHHDFESYDTGCDCANA